MNHRQTILSASILAALLLSGTAIAQDGAQAQSDQATTTQKKKKTETDKEKLTYTQLQAVNVVGIRSSEQLSLDTKQYADSHVEVVSAVDIGKLPAKNVADTIAQLPGVNIADAAGAEGGFDEADRASIRGSAPSLTLTTLNGHALASGDWFVVGGGGTRSVSYSMLPSEIVSQVVVHKSSEANLLEGGAAGSIDIITRKPLEFSKPFSAEASIGGVYSDLPGKTKPQFNGLVNWKNADNTFGVMVEGFYEERSLQREGQEILGYSYIPAGSAVATQLGLTDKGNGSTGVFYPNLPGAALFTQTRKRKGGSIDIQWKALDNLTFNLDGFYSKMDATDYNRNYMLRTRDRLPGDTLTSYNINDNVLTSAGIAAAPGVSQGIYDMISRPGESESSQFATLDADWKVTSNFDLKFQAGTTRGTGNTPTQDVMEMDTGYGQSASYSMNGLGKPVNWTLGGVNNVYDPSTVGLDWIFGEQDVHVIDKEHWFQADGEVDFDQGVLSSLQFGARYAKHSHNSPTDVAQGVNFASNVTFGTNATIWPSSSATYPGSFASDLGVGQMPSNIWYWTPSQLAALNTTYANRNVTGDTSSRLYPNGIYSMDEQNSAAYFQANFAGDTWSGNVGLRYISTDENVGYTSASILENSYTGPYLNSAFYPGGWYFNHYKHHYGKLLPSFNLKANLNEDGSLLARFAASQTITRQDYGQLAGFVSLSDPTVASDIGGGSGPNPYLKPLISTNFDASLEWYFSKRGLLAMSVYEMDLHNYYDYGGVTRTYLNNYLTYGAGNPSHTPVYSNYLVSVPVNVNGTLKGVELNYIQPIGDNFGAQVNYTYSNGHSTGGTYLYNTDGTLADNRAAGDRPLFGTSRNTVNLSAYYENSHWNARVNYTYRSEFYDGMMNNSGAGMPLLPYWQAGTGYLSFSAGYTLNDHVSFSFDAMNLNNPTLRYYIKGQQAGLGFYKAPEAFYTNGRQYYLTVNFKF